MEKAQTNNSYERVNFRQVDKKSQLPNRERSGAFERIGEFKGGERTNVCAFFFNLELMIAQPNKTTHLVGIYFP